MQAKNLSGGQELLCINTEKVYDWILNEANFELILTDEDLPIVDEEALTCDDIILDEVTCEVTPDPVTPFEELSREDRSFVIDGTLITLQLVTIRKNFVVTLTFPLVAGGADATAEFPFSRCEQVVLCAPTGTDIEITFTELDCFVCDFDCDVDGTFDAVINVRLCQSIQSTFDVTLEIVADFCEPREELPVPSCPAPTIPPQCPVLFPNDDNGE
ncbi:hypothetical protein [Thalassobacillus pellis]|uniref:hypothetical protein n=1 Tax=Thalassobacillus pellis TaxID=748008 RepID=UPI00195FBF14|nr:hypothetical protein [Thalassobacillus pellis]MBM7553620.1 hypothetical protein [Thalassobacillus pellis]